MRYGKTVSIKNKSVAPSKKCIQEFVLIEKFGKFRRIFAYFKSELAKVGNNAKLLPRTFIFCQKSLTCEKVAIGLEQAGIPVIPLSGIRAQNLREEAIREFRDNNVSVLTVTDIASRGIDIKDVDVVINFDMPLNYTTYVHRVGRAGRIRNG
uniref:Helicase C-terminal domain-containing protein n=1 Tax=Panagrolaimus superbus TaxID=310955 RepID=A0A914YXX2_9BILA